MELKFRPQVDVEIDYQSKMVEGYQFNYRNYKNIKVDYKTSLITRDWGFCVMVVCPDQTLSLDLEVMTEIDGEDLVVPLTILLEDNETDISERKLEGDIAPSLLEINITTIKKVGDKFEAKGKGKLIF